MRSVTDLLLASALGALIAVGLYAFAVGTRLEAAYNPVPSGTVSYFNKSRATGCPTGWTEFTTARGAYIVGLPLVGATLNTLVGNALSDQENRTVGLHSHTYTPENTMAGAGAVSGTANSIKADRATVTGTNIQTGALTATDNAGAVAGTNAPYIELLVCQKS